MESEEFLTSKDASGVIISACSLWSHLTVISIILLIVSIIKPLILSNGLYINIAIILFILTQFICLRLNLDYKLFKYIYSCDNIKDFDAGIKFLFNKDKKDTSFLRRWLGTKKLIKKTYVYLVMQFIFAVIVYST